MGMIGTFHIINCITIKRVLNIFLLFSLFFFLSDYNEQESNKRFQDCLDDIDGIRVDGYVVFKSKDENVVLPYPKEEKISKGMSFHHGKFIMKLREKVIKSNRYRTN